MSNDAKDIIICHDCDNPACEVCDSTPELCGRKKEKDDNKREDQEKKACLIDHT